MLKIIFSKNKMALKPIIKIKDLEVVYNKGKTNQVDALKNINLEIYPEEYIIFFGPSGCGKSTLLNIIAGLEVPSSGEIVVDNRNLATMNADELADYHRNSIGMIFQAYNLLSTLSVLDNVILPEVFNKVKKSNRPERAKMLLKTLGVLDYARRLPQELSGGQQQRVGISRSLINNPRILLADEPIGNLDSKSAENVLEILDNLNKKEKKTIILVTHSPENLVHADRIYHIKDGRIIKEEINKAKPEVAKELEKTSEVKRVTAFDKLIESYPELSDNQLNVLLMPFKAKMIANYLTRILEEIEIRRLEKFIENRLYDRIQEKTLNEFLDLSFDEGGVGLNKQTAQKFTVLVEEVLTKAKFLKREVFGAAGGDMSVIDFKSTELSRYFQKSYELNIEGEQFKNLRNAVKARILNKMGKKEFNEILDIGPKDGGVGLDTRTARQISRHLELILLVRYGM